MGTIRVGKKQIFQDKIVQRAFTASQDYGQTDGTDYSSVHSDPK